VMGAGDADWASASQARLVRAMRTTATGRCTAV
jgi:hypothetical protein